MNNFQFMYMLNFIDLYPYPILVIMNEIFTVEASRAIEVCAMLVFLEGCISC